MDFRSVGDFGGLAEHDRGRAVLFRRQLNGAFDVLGAQVFARQDEMDMDSGKHLGIAISPFGFELHFTAA